MYLNKQLQDLHARIKKLEADTPEKSLPRTLAVIAGWDMAHAGHTCKSDISVLKTATRTVKLAEQYVALGTDHPLVKCYEEFWVGKDEDADVVWELRGDEYNLLDDIGMCWKPKNTEQLITGLLVQLQRSFVEHKIAIAEREAYKKEFGFYEEDEDEDKDEEEARNNVSENAMAATM